MEHMEFKADWRIISSQDANLSNLLRAQNETNRLLAAIGTLLEERAKAEGLKEFAMWEGGQ